MDQPSDDDEAHRPRQQGGGVAPPSPTSTRPGSPEVCDEVGYFMRTGLQNVLNLSGVPIIASDWCNAACNMIEVVIRYMETKKPGRLFASVLGARDEEGERRAEAREKKAEDRERRAEERERKAEERERKAEDREKRAEERAESREKLWEDRKKEWEAPEKERDTREQRTEIRQEISDKNISDNVA
ncbi:hypothetical protein MJO28_010568 [Puccinia striiformis f. sp. tritici]|uniref:Uncharacterized protein n=1 Tax=Puccinia striiformis f. sp. tritici TaxID=168172 RepID=A0ACC0E7Z5_9BASI|nr:hypothetical protein Pst134EB_020257 [Puccinia striiformis f. sp. tritici]KAI7944873.1 hypothetical protein MJO28_010568 [Puccinia striiformis f. sp. tritici]